MCQIVVSVEFATSLLLMASVQSYIVR